MKTTMKLLGIITIIAVIGFSMIACDNGGGDSNNNNNENNNNGENGNGNGNGNGKDNNNGGGGINTYISYDGDGSRYKLVVTENPSRAAFTPQSGDTYTLTVEGLGWGTSTGTVTGFSGGSYTLSNNGTALNLATSSEAISSIPEAIVYDAGEHSQMSDGTKTPNGSMVTKSIYFGTWGDGTNTLTMTTTGWTFSAPGGGMNPGFNYSGTYTIAEAMTGTVYRLNINNIPYHASVNYYDHDQINLAPDVWQEAQDYDFTRQ